MNADQTEIYTSYQYYMSVNEGIAACYAEVDAVIQQNQFCLSMIPIAQAGSCPITLLRRMAVRTIITQVSTNQLLYDFQLFDLFALKNVSLCYPCADCYSSRKQFLSDFN